MPVVEFAVIYPNGEWYPRQEVVYSTDHRRILEQLLELAGQDDICNVSYVGEHGIVWVTPPRKLDLGLLMSPDLVS